MQNDSLKKAEKLATAMQEDPHLIIKFQKAVMFLS